MRKLFLSFACLIISGCGIVFQPPLDAEDLELKKEGHNPRHVNACGARAIQDVAEKFDIKISRRDISDSIQNNWMGNIGRSFLGVFFSDGQEITWPSEMALELEKRGFTVSEINGTDVELRSFLKTLDKNQVKGIMLVKDGDSVCHHYAAFPPLSDGFYQYSNGRILKVYVVARPHSSKKL